MGLGIMVGFFGVQILFHAGFGHAYLILGLICCGRGFVKVYGGRVFGASMNVVTDLFLGMVLCTWAALTVPGKFLSIHPDSEENRLVSLPANVDFMIFTHRGKAFPMDMEVNPRH